MIILFTLITLSYAWPSWRHLGSEILGFDDSTTCNFSRDDALICIADYVDANHDQEISAEEFERAKRLYLPRRARFAAWVAHEVHQDLSIQMVMAGCDVSPKDGKLTLSDWAGGAKTCLPGQSDLCQLKTVCDIAKNKV